MYKTRLCLSTSEEFGISVPEQIKLFKETGFEAFFTMWDENVEEYQALAKDIGMIYQSVHAPFLNSAKMWSVGDEAEAAVTELLTCVKDCAKLDIPLLVVHPYIGFDEVENPTESGVQNFGIIVDEAKKEGVKIAFENVEGELYLKTLMETFQEYDNVGFCWDSGHEQCYNRGEDMLALYGNRLIATHLNDNLGVRDYDGKITWIDDLHMLPGDGIINWNDAVSRLNKCGFDGILTFELNKRSKPGRVENDKYEKLSLKEYISECYARACKIASMKCEAHR